MVKLLSKIPGILSDISEILRVAEKVMDSVKDWKAENARDKNGLTLHKAANAGKAEEVKGLLERGADVEARDEDGATALHKAANAGKAAVVKLLLEYGADVEAQNEKERTALHVAAEVDKAAVVKLLLEAGANVRAKDEDGRTPRDLATAKSTRRLLDQVLRRWKIKIALLCILGISLVVGISLVISILNP